MKQLACQLVIVYKSRIKKEGKKSLCSLLLLLLAFILPWLGKKGVRGKESRTQVKERKKKRRKLGYIYYSYYSATRNYLEDKHKKTSGGSTFLGYIPSRTRLLPLTVYI